jgi:hypothetical protein
VYSGIKLNHWIGGKLEPPPDDPKLRMDFPFITKQIDEFAKNEGKNPMDFRKELMENIAKTMRSVFLNFVFETIKNYSDNNPSKDIITKLMQHDWFLMLIALRHNASHFGNYGKPVVLKWTNKWPASKTLTWNGLTITDQTQGQDLSFSDEYAMRLINYTLDHLYNNKTIYG